MTAETELLRLVITDDTDVFAVRQRGREVAEALGLDTQNQVRVATVLSDVGRDVVRAGLSALVRFKVSAEGLGIEFEWPTGPDPAVLGTGLATAAKLMDAVRSGHAEGRTRLTMIKRRPASLPTLTRAAVAAVRHELGRHAVTSPLDELRAQNQELLDTLDSLERKRQELQRLNDELAETNRGVVALYKELSEELEETNRGVVALYAEVNEKTIQLKQASEAKTRFWSTISHELRAPVNSIVGLTRLLDAAGSDPLTDEQRRQVGLIEHSGTTLLALVNELLDTAKAESGQLVPQLAPVELRAVLLQLRGTLRSTTPSTEVRLVIAEPDPALRLDTDETLLVRILRNLLSNGLKFTERGEVRLDVRPEPDSAAVTFEVSDTGIGIPVDEQERVFEEFHQVRHRLQVATPGTGLGLPYARRLAELLGGSLTLRSTPREGTTVTLRLPTHAPGEDPAGDFGTILVVDDEEDFRRRLTGLLEDVFTGEVRQAPDGRTALEIVAEHRPGLVFLDLVMPGMHGRDVLGVLREKPELREVPVVVVTSADPDGLDLSRTGLRAALLPKSQLSAEAVRLAVSQAFAVVRRTVP
ncbi:ATP-binding protein [Amycolatopsis rhabdoformis]|uniref:histidine kinase n=1 Tax=Amycolatopsis rhabdoformis TaxID=1448059 RepID=A0ABZ1IDE8_9PSEU|nr:ATP-binding protein [Amycolatopsis rhabdoformis]WSE32094.1 ATP-binding protein [Amycolatopsis rhabdoformis]